MQRTKPPFRADHVGSLLRPAALQGGARQARQGRDHAPPSSRRSRTARSSASSRSRRRSACNRSPTASSAARGGISISSGASTASRSTSWTPASRSPPCTTRNEGVKVTGKLGFAGHPMIEHFKFVAAHTKRTPKITIPAPSAIYGRPVATPIDKAAYPEHGRVLGRSRPGLQQGGARLRRRRLPLSAARRGVHRHAVRSEVPRADEEARRRSGEARPALRRPDQRGDVGHSRPT